RAPAPRAGFRQSRHDFWQHLARLRQQQDTVGAEVPGQPGECRVSRRLADDHGTSIREQVSHSLQERKLELQVAPDAEDQDAWPAATQEGHTFSEVARVTQRPLLLPRLLLQHRRQERVVLVDKHLRVSHGGNASEPDRTLPRSDAAAPTPPPAPPARLVTISGPGESVAFPHQSSETGYSKGDERIHGISDQRNVLYVSMVGLVKQAVQRSVSVISCHRSNSPAER